MNDPRRRPLLVLLVLVLLVLLGSAIRPHDYPTWLMEVAPVILVAPVLVLSYRKYPLSTLLYGLIAVHACILMVGGHYTYAQVPVGDWVKATFGLMRNPYDKLGHLAQGFVPALVLREFLLQGGHLRRGWVLTLVVVLSVLGISAAYELIEWGAAVALGQGADAFLGTQGDPWDTQSDMGCALLGAVVALVSCGRIQDRQIQQRPWSGSPQP